ncbi:hypothetical protein TNCV_3790511 [Trichonephila clavipes]|nr:hypothetical protein TNCV_3790511 [Trichonephila clavipes]
MDACTRPPSAVSTEVQAACRRPTESVSVGTTSRYFNFLRLPYGGKINSWSSSDYGGRRTRLQRPIQFLEYAISSQSRTGAHKCLQSNHAFIYHHSFVNILPYFSHRNGLYWYCSLGISYILQTKNMVV